MKVLDKLRELCEIEEGMNDWEVNFVDDVARRVEAGYELTPKQIVKIQEMHDQYCR